MTSHARKKARIRARQSAEGDIAYSVAARRGGIPENIDPTGESEPDSRRTLLDVAGEMITRITGTDPADTETAMLAGWEALTSTEVLDLLLGHHIAAVDHLPFAGFSWQTGDCQLRIDVAVSWLEAAPSLPNTANVTAAEPGLLEYPLVAAALADRAMGPGIRELPGFDQAEKRILAGAQIVRIAIRTVWLRTHALLTAAAEHAHTLEDARGCRVAALMAAELADPEDVDERRDLARRVVAAANPVRFDRETLRADTALVNALRTAIDRSARPDGWARLPKLVAALRRADHTWMPERWGFDTDLGLISATNLFDIRKVQDKGQRIPEIRVRDTGTHR